MSSQLPGRSWGTRRRRDRHGRGIRGPLALPNAYTREPADPPRPANRADFFAEAVEEALRRIARNSPEALTGVRLGIEDVPSLDLTWSGGQVPLAAAVDAVDGRPPQIVIYRRPLEHRAASRRGLRILVFRTIVEQLAALTGRSVDELDPEGAGYDDD